MNKFNRSIYLIFYLLLTVIVYSQEIPELIIVTEDWKPYHYIEDGEFKGIVIDIMLLMLQELDSEQDLNDIELYPWARAYRTLLNKKNTILFSMTRTDKREELFKWAGPIFDNTTYLISKKSRSIELDNITSLKYYKIGTILEDVSEDYIQQLGIDINSLKRTSRSQNLIKMLVNDRIDIMACGWTAFVNDAKLAGVSSEDYEPIYIVDKSDVSFAFNIETSDHIVSMFQQSFNNIKKSGELEKIFTKYGEYYYEFVEE